MKKYIILFSVIVAFLLSGCTDLFDPQDENERDLDGIYEDAAFAEGLLLNGYIRLPTGGWSFNDVATDDAVTNDKFNDYSRMATGLWSQSFNPTDRWSGCFAAIQYLNILLDETDDIKWSTRNEVVSILFNDRFKGEAYGLRACFMYYVLQAHAGVGASGDLLGIPIITERLDKGGLDYNMVRSSFKECVDQIYKDLDEAEKYLPLDFEDIPDGGDLPGKYDHLELTREDYNRVFGKENRQRITSRIVKGIRAKVSLLAASPAYASANAATWEDAANHAGEVLALIGGISGLAQGGGKWYYPDDIWGELNNIGQGINPPEILWRVNIEENRSLEEEHFPPSMYGRGRVNPTQNLVDAFPMKNGYPKDHAQSGYNPKKPYENRDPRLQRYIIVDGSKLGPSGTVINTLTGSGDDATNQISTSTRTGYYMRKLLREDVIVNPMNPNVQKHLTPHIRYTELFLAYAEAANQAWGPDGTGQFGYSARDVVAAIRTRAGIDSQDGYLASISGKEAMGELIKNERRLELCFEGHRFWDLRRWEKDLTESAKGVRLVEDNYVVTEVERRAYRDYMKYGPIPYTEVLKWSLLEQNKGW